MRRSIYLMLACGFALAAAGCGGGTIPIEGKVTYGAQPYTLADGEGISVNLTKDDGASSGSGSVTSDGSFKILGAEGKGVPPGNYKVQITHYVVPKGAKVGTAASPTGKTAKETWEVSSSNRNFTLDLSKYK